ncbi:MAG: hypothetical protein AAGJ82_11325, partial [Bacteroidota bacterium]
MKKSMFYGLVIVGCLFTCTPERDGYTENGFGYDLHQTAHQAPAQIGEQAWADIRIYTPDTVLFESPQPRPTVIRKELPDEEPDLLRDAMRTLGAGDSATFYLPTPDEIQHLPQLEGAAYLRYDIVVYETGPAGSKPTFLPPNTDENQWRTPPASQTNALLAHPEGAAAYAALEAFQQHYFETVGLDS